MRLKERAEDYKYFIEPDLPVLQLTEAYIDEIRHTLPELLSTNTKGICTNMLLPKTSLPF